MEAVRKWVSELKDEEIIEKIEIKLKEIKE